MHLIDLIFPRKCLSCGALGKYACLKCVSAMRRIPTTANECGLVEYKGPFEKILKTAKYGMYEKVLQDLVDGLLECHHEKILKYITGIHGGVFIPVPLHSARLRTRGFNQALLIVRALARKYKILINTSCVIRNINTPRLAGLNKMQRAENINGAFKVVAQVPQSCVLIDDVYTSGATLRELSRVLLNHGAERIHTFTLARRWYNGARDLKNLQGGP